MCVSWFYCDEASPLWMGRAQVLDIGAAGPLYVMTRLIVDFPLRPSDADVGRQRAFTAPAGMNAGKRHDGLKRFNEISDGAFEPSYVVDVRKRTFRTQAIDTG